MDAMSRIRESDQAKASIQDAIENWGPIRVWQLIQLGVTRPNESEQDLEPPPRAYVLELLDVLTRLPEWMIRERFDTLEVNETGRAVQRLVLALTEPYLAKP